MGNPFDADQYLFNNYFPEELRNAQDTITKYKSEHSDLEQKLTNFATQIEDLQTAAAIAAVGKEDEVDKAKRQHNEELASFQHILDGM